MTVRIADNIVSPLGFTSWENYHAVFMGKTALKMRDGVFGVPEPFMASIIDDGQLEQAFRELIPDGWMTPDYTKVEKAAIVSAADALRYADIDPAAEDVVFVISTTKGNVHLLDGWRPSGSVKPFLWHTAKNIAKFFFNRNEPLVVSLACTSGCAAQIAAMRLLESGRYRYAVVVGVDMLSKFVVSGFQSFKALSQEECRPFDRDRAGLNLGEGAATIIYEHVTDISEIDHDSIILRKGAIRNDANHISGPSRTAEGLYRCLVSVTEGMDVDDLLFINAHGTATLYNDDMESVAVFRAGLDGIPVCSIKGCFGHTLGASGVIETIISSHALQEELIPPTRGFENPGTVERVKISKAVAGIEGCSSFIKMVSGFGGVNAALLLSLGRYLGEQ